MPRLSQVVHLAVLSMVSFSSVVSLAEPAGSTFTFQGRLNSSGGPAAGIHNFEFGLYDAEAGGVQIGTSVSLSAVQVSGGLFSVPLDFGQGAFGSDARWVHLAVRKDTEPTTTVLFPRQRLRPSPQSLFSGHAATADVATTAAAAYVAGEATMAASAAVATTSTYSLQATSAVTADLASTASHALTATTASVAMTANTATSAAMASFAERAAFAEVSGTATTATMAEVAITALTANRAAQVVRNFPVRPGASISAGDVVAFIKDGVEPFSPPLEFSLDPSGAGLVSAVALTSSTIVFAYNAGSPSTGRVVAGTFVGSTLTFGSPVNLPRAIRATDIVGLSPSRFAVTYIESAGNSGVFSVAGDLSPEGGISLGSEVVVAPTGISVTFAETVSGTQYVIVYRGAGVRSSRLATVSGNAISLGTAVPYSPDGEVVSVSRLANNKFVIVQLAGYNGIVEGSAVVGSINGSTLSYGGKSAFVADNIQDLVGSAVSGSQFVVAYADFNGSIGKFTGKTVIGTVVGASVIWSESVTFNPANAGNLSLTSSQESGEVLLSYTDGGAGSRSTQRIGFFDGIRINWSPEQTFRVGAASANVALFLTGNSFLFTSPLSIQTPSLPIGIALSDAGGGQNVPVTVLGVSSSHSGLTPGVLYYAGRDGKLQSQESVLPIGLAVSPTEVLLNGDLLRF